MYGLGIAKGMALTFRHLFRRRITVSYPEQKLIPDNPDEWRRLSKRFRGYDFTWYVDKCTGCGTCAKACPQGNIEIETHREGKRLGVDKFSIDIGRDMFCGLCVEACPYDAIYMGTGYECASYVRSKLVYTRDQFIEKEKRPSAYFHPELEHKAPEAAAEMPAPVTPNAKPPAEKPAETPVPAMAARS